MKKRLLLQYFLLFGLILVGCDIPEQAPVRQPTATSSRIPDEPSEVPPPETSTSSPAPTSTPAPTYTPIPTHTLVPMITSTPTPLPVISLAVPSEWQTRANAALAILNEEPRSQEWQMAPYETADIHLLKEEGAFVVKKEPLALVVPFTTEWENISYDQALNIISKGHDLVKVMLWSEMPSSHKALRIDGLFLNDLDYPLQETWSLQASPGHEDALTELLPVLQTSSVDPLVHLVAVGDIMLDRSLGYNLQHGDLTYPFSAVSKPLQEADITIGNVESALGDMGSPASKRYPFRAPPEAAEALALAGFDIVSLANNHAMDYGPETLLHAISLLRERGIATIGAGANAQEAHEPVITEINGLKLAFLAYVNVPVEASTGFDTASWTATDNSPGLAWAASDQISIDVDAIRDRADLVVIVLHSGFEYVAAPSEPQVDAAHAAVDAGADLVIGHHAHILQGIEFYGDGVIIYGTGNFAFEIDGPPETALFDIWLDGNGVRQIEIKPAIIKFGGQPRLAEAWEAPVILNQVYHLTNLLNSR